MKNKSSNLLRISVSIFVVAFLLQVVVCNHVAVKTRELNSVSQQIVDLQNQISVINQEIYMASSIVNMEEKAKEQGFFLMETPVKSITDPTIARAF
jgi:cell division protein FtsL